MLEHKIARDYGANCNIEFDFQREDLFWSMMLYEVESQEMKQAKQKPKGVR